MNFKAELLVIYKNIFIYLSKIILHMSKKYELIDSGKYNMDSFITGLKFYKTKYEDIYITDQDINTGKDLKENGLMAFISTGKFKSQTKFTMEFLNDEATMNFAIEDFYQFIKQHK